MSLRLVRTMQPMGRADAHERSEHTADLRSRICDRGSRIA